MKHLLAKPQDFQTSSCWNIGMPPVPCLSTSAPVTVFNLCLVAKLVNCAQFRSSPSDALRKSREPSPPLNTVQEVPVPAAATRTQQEMHSIQDSGRPRLCPGNTFEAHHKLIDNRTRSMFEAHHKVIDNHARSMFEAHPYTTMSSQ